MEPNHEMSFFTDIPGHDPILNKNIGFSAFSCRSVTKRKFSAVAPHLNSEWGFFLPYRKPGLREWREGYGREERIILKN